MVIDTIDAAFQNGKVILGSVGMDETTQTHVLIRGMIDRAVARKLGAHHAIGRKLVRHEVRLAARHFDDNGLQRAGLDVGDMEGSCATIAIDQRHNSVLFRLRLVGAVLGLAANKSFVWLNNFVFTTELTGSNIVHGGTKPMAHEPSGFVSDLQRAV